MGAFGPHYPPFLQDAVDHAERLVEVLHAIDPRSARRGAASWLVGRASEVECLVAELTADWKKGTMAEQDAACAVNAYVHALHRGLAMNFGELAPSCCVHSLIITSTPASFLATTRSLPCSIDGRAVEVTSTWAEVDESELIPQTKVSGGI
jgi:hypothetical protein